MIAMYSIHFDRPLWLLLALTAVPVIWLAWRHLAALGRMRRIMAAVCRVLVILLLAALLAHPSLRKQHDHVTVIVGLDRSRSVPEDLRQGARQYVEQAWKRKPHGDQVAVIDLAERPLIERLPGGDNDTEIDERVPSLMGNHTNLAAAVQLAMAIAPSDTANRILLVSDGNQTLGDALEAARVAATNHIPIDVLPVSYNYDREVILKRVVTPQTARTGQTVSVRFVLQSTAESQGRLNLTLNNRMVDLDPDSDSFGAPVTLRPGTNVKTVQLPIGEKGLYEFEARFDPDDERQDTLSQNNTASSATFVAGPGHILVVDQGDGAGRQIAEALTEAGVNVRSAVVGQFPFQLTEMLDIDGVVLANMPCHQFNLAQQEMICQYVKELGGGLVMVGGPDAFGAGGWIGSPVAEILPVNIDPMQRKQMPKGALALIMHSCEMPDGNYWGQQVAIAAVKALSSKDLVGVISYGWNSGTGVWDHPLGPAGDKTAVIAAIKKMQMGDMPDFHQPMQAAYTKLVSCDAVQKHVIMISDGDPSPPTQALLNQFKTAGITVTGVAVFPHSPQDVQSLQRIAQATGGRFYNVTNPKSLPQIFIKEAQTVKRSLIIEKEFRPDVTSGLSEIVRGIGGSLPQLDGYVLTDEMGGVSDLIVTGPEKDPILASRQVGVGRTVAFTSTADSRWAGSWANWGGYGRFWEQTVRWAAKSSQSPECEVFADVEGRTVTVTVEAQDAKGEFVQFSEITGRAIGPDMEPKDISLSQVGPGQYRAKFTAGLSGSYLVNLRYRKAGEPDRLGMAQSVVTVPYAPEFSDLTDNFALLSQIAKETGGRVLSGPADEVDLFTRAGLAFPETPLPTIKPLVILWLILFILDVAVRRVAVDVRAMGRKLRELIKRRFGLRPGEDKTYMEALIKRKKGVHEKLTQPEKEKARARRFTAAPGAKIDLPDKEFLAPIRSKSADADKEAKTGTQPAEESSMDRLLKAKRRAGRDTGRQDKDESS